MADAERRGDLNRAAELRFGTLHQLEQAARGRERAPRRAARRRAACSRRRSTRRTSPRSWPSGPASRSPACSRARSRSSSRWRSGSAGAWSASPRRSARSSNAVRRARSGLSDPNRPIGSFLFLGPDRRRQDGAGAGARRVPVRRRAGHDPDRHVRVHGEAHGGPAHRRARRATSATTRAASSPRRCGGARTRSCSSTRSRRRTPTSSTCCSSSSTTAGSPTATGRTVDFRNTVVIMTSNLGSHHFREVGGPGQGAPAGAGGAAAAPPAGVPEPDRRGHRLPAARAATRSSAIVDIQARAPAEAPGRQADHARAHATARRRCSPGRATTRSSARGRSSGRSSGWCRTRWRSSCSRGRSSRGTPCGSMPEGTS